MKNPYRELEDFYNGGYLLLTSGEIIRKDKIIFATKHERHVLTIYKGQKLCFHARDTKHFLRQFRRWRKRNESI